MTKRSHIAIFDVVRCYRWKHLGAAGGGVELARADHPAVVATERLLAAHRREVAAEAVGGTIGGLIAPRLAAAAKGTKDSTANGADWGPWDVAREDAAVAQRAVVALGLAADLPLEPEHRLSIRRTWDAARKGYQPLCEIDGQLLVFAKGD